MLLASLCSISPKVRQIRTRIVVSIDHFRDTCSQFDLRRGMALTVGSVTFVEQNADGRGDEDALLVKSNQAGGWFD